MPDSPTDTADASLGNFGTGTEAESINDLKQPTPESVYETFDDLSQFRSVVASPDLPADLIVGEWTDVANPHDAYRLYYGADSDRYTEFAGLLIARSTINSKTGEFDRFVGYVDEQAAPSWDGPVIPLNSLTAAPYKAIQQVDEMLPAIRTELTGVECTENRVDTGYGDWLTAVNRLSDYIHEEVDTHEIRITASVVMQSRIMHGIARYPHDASTLLSQAGSSFQEQCESGYEKATPIGLLEVLLQFADTLDVEE